MSVPVIIGSIVADIAKEALSWAVDHAKARAEQVVRDNVPREVIEQMLAAELELLVLATKRIEDAFAPPGPHDGMVPPLGLDVEIVESWDCDHCEAKFEHLEELEAHEHDKHPETIRT